MKTILICTDGSSFAESVYKYGAWFAIQLNAKLNVLFVTDIQSQKVSSTGNLSGSIGLGASENLLNELVNLEHEKAKLNNQRARLILQNASEALTSEGIKDFQLTNKTGFLVDCFHEFEENSDLIVLGKGGETADFGFGHLGANVDRIVRSSSKPCLVTPREFKTIERILIAYDGSLSGQKILQFLGDYPCFQNLEIHLLTVAKSNSDQTALARLNEAKQWLQRARFEPVCSLLEGEPEKAIVNYITQQDISLLLMGAYGHSRIRHLVIGSTTTQILQSSNIPVLVFR
ncbi:universal stress protein [Nostoc flagelliforme FACHB-838]|uniref:Universal stress protein n=1 Tax=Nostoc flagelliforme FACHB-838 TaxID=2692904 RepID=A0ABR8DIJ6_9NOSO|nr:universal stress protein [Nostoc flagelliforme]MBD2529337.1 universal stress protein [Nostoc flagelliforme FACHB-838]